MSVIDQTAPLTIEKAATADDKTLATVGKLSVREFYPGTWGGISGSGDGLGFFMPAQLGLLSPYGTVDCDRQLRMLHYAEQNALWSGAANVWDEKILSTPFEIKGGRNQTYQWQDIFFASDFGEGYDFMMSKFLTDYKTLNRGAFIEKVAYGDPDTPLADDARIVGLNHLDAMRMLITGNRDYPYIYFSEFTGEMHRMHRTRVLRLTHSPNPNTSLFGMGKSILYDALTVANAQILLGRAQNEMLSDMPPAGLIVFNNIKGEDISTALAQFESMRQRDGQQVWRAPLHLESKNPAEPATVEFIPLAQMPKDYDYEKYMRSHVNLLALTMGLDPQDIWPLASATMGSGMQSEVLAKKTSGKGPGYLLTRLERMWNTVMPRAMEFKYKAANAQAGKEEADIALAWVSVLEKAKWMTDDEKRQVSANQIEAFTDALLDEDGELIRLPDSDPKDEQQQTQIIALDNIETANAPKDMTASDTVQVGQQDSAPPNATEQLAVKKAGGQQKPVKLEKRADAFTTTMAGILSKATAKDVTKPIALAQMRAALATNVQGVYEDVLDEYDIDELDESDYDELDDILEEQDGYITSLADQIYSEEGMVGTPDNRAEKWAGAIALAYYAALQAADENGKYIFTGDDGKESCSTCQMLGGQIHRMKWWVDNEYRPGVDHHNFECGTWEGGCAHYLERLD